MENSDRRIIKGVLAGALVTLTGLGLFASQGQYGLIDAVAQQRQAAQGPLPGGLDVDCRGAMTLAATARGDSWIELDVTVDPAAALPADHAGSLTMWDSASGLVVLGTWDIPVGRTTRFATYIYHGEHYALGVELRDTSQTSPHQVRTSCGAPRGAAGRIGDGRTKRLPKGGLSASEVSLQTYSALGSRRRWARNRRSRPDIRDERPALYVWRDVTRRLARAP